MPEFLDYFVSQVRMKRERLRSYLSVGRPSPLANELGVLLQSEWHGLPITGGIPRNVFAVDGSRALRFYVVGSILYVVRAVGVSGKERIRDLEVDSFFSRSNARDIHRFVNRKMEWLEHRVAAQAAEKLDDGGFVLIDGTLHGRMMAVPRDSAAEGQKNFMLQYFDDYMRLFEVCRKKGVVPVGVSKDSRAAFLRDHLLGIMLERYLEESKLTHSERERVRRIFDDLLNGNTSELVSLARIQSSLDDKLELIMREARSSTTDHQMITNFVDDVGYSTPLELGVYGRGKGLVRQYIESPLSYLGTHFKEAYDEAEDKNWFLEWGRDVLSSIPRLPTIVSFHVLLDKRDSPLRIDVPSWLFGLDNTLADKVGFSPIKSSNKHIEEIIDMLRVGYGGLRNYNVFLVQAHREAKLERGTMDTLYHRILEKELSVSHPLIHVRGDRRVRYP